MNTIAMLDGSIRTVELGTLEAIELCERVARTSGRAARARANARTARTSERRSARRVKYAAQPFNAETLLADLRNERTAQ